MDKKLVYLRKRGTLESICVFHGDPICYNNTLDPITEDEHKALIQGRAEKKSLDEMDEILAGMQPKGGDKPKRRRRRKKMTEEGGKESAETEENNEAGESEDE